MRMTDWLQHYPGVARLLQQEGDVLEGVSQEEASQDEEGDAALTRARSPTHVSRPPAPRRAPWGRPRQTWEVRIPHAGEATRQAVMACFQAQQGMRRPFVCEIPAADGAGRLPALVSAHFVAAEELLILQGGSGAEGPALRCPVRWDMWGLTIHAQAPGLYEMPRLRLVQVWS